MYKTKRDSLIPNLGRVPQTFNEFLKRTLGRLGSNERILYFLFNLGDLWTIGYGST